MPPVIVLMTLTDRVCADDNPLVSQALDYLVAAGDIYPATELPAPTYRLV